MSSSCWTLCLLVGGEQVQGLSCVSGPFELWLRTKNRGDIRCFPGGTETTLKPLWLYLVPKPVNSLAALRSLTVCWGLMSCHIIEMWVWQVWLGPGKPGDAGSPQVTRMCVRLLSNSEATAFFSESRCFYTLHVPSAPALEQKWLKGWALETGSGLLLQGGRHSGILWSAEQVCGFWMKT